MTTNRKLLADCGAPWGRVIGQPELHNDGLTLSGYPGGSKANKLARLRQAARAKGQEYSRDAKTLGWRPTCGCDAEAVPAVVLDPFVGSGTTCVVAEALGRRAVGVDLNPGYLDLAIGRIEAGTRR